MICILEKYALETGDITKQYAQAIKRELSNTIECVHGGHIGGARQ